MMLGKRKYKTLAFFVCLFCKDKESDFCPEAGYF